MKTDYDKIGRICVRAIARKLIPNARRATLLMDLECACNEFNLDLDALLAFDELNFAHDIVGIQNHINRKTKQFTNCFVPRAARPNKKEEK